MPRRRTCRQSRRVSVPRLTARRAGGGQARGAKEPCFAAAEIEGKGRGAVATRDVEEGELVLAEAPLLAWNAEFRSAQGVNAFETDAAYVEQKFSALSSEVQARLLGLYDRFAGRGEAKSLLGILSTNGFELPDGRMAVFDSLSLFNHSCLPNCDTRWHAQTGSRHVYASNRIPQGQELCIKYIDVRAPRAARQALLDGWGFTCRCEACSDPRGDSDERRTRMFQLNPDAGLEDTSEPRVVIDSLMELLRLYDEEGLTSKQHRKRALQLLFQHSMDAGEFFAAEGYLTQACQEARLCAAPDDEETQLMDSTLQHLSQKLDPLRQQGRGREQAS